jgi:hypothetical protein
MGGFVAPMLLWKTAFDMVPAISGHMMILSVVSVESSKLDRLQKCSSGLPFFRDVPCPVSKCIYTHSHLLDMLLA